MRSTHELAEFVATLGAAGSEPASARATVERAAEALDADIAAIVRNGELLAVVGFPEGREPVEALGRVSPGVTGSGLEVPGVGTCVAAAASLEHPSGATLVVARPTALTPQETGLLHGMARVASMTMRMQRVLHDERAARVESERLAREQEALRRVATLVAKAASSEDVLSAVAEELALLAEADIVKVLRYEPGRAATIVGSWGDPEMHLPIGKRFAVAGEGVAVSVLRTGRPARTVRVAGPPGSVADAFRRAGAMVASGGPILVDGRLWGVVIAALTRPEPLPQEPLPLPPEAEARIVAFTELAATAIANAHARGALRAAADEQTALRRVATLVARGEPSEAVFGAVAEEVGSVLPAADVALVSRYDGDGVAEIVGGWSRAGGAPFVGERTPLGGRNVTTLVFERNEPARVAYLAGDASHLAKAARQAGVRSAAGAPIHVEGRLWGVMIVASMREDALPSGIERSLADFTDLVATAIAEAEAQEEVRRVANEQAALRRVATVVAHDEPPAAVFEGVADEVGRLFGADASGVVRYEPGGAVTAVGSWVASGSTIRPRLRRATLGGHNISTLVFETGRPARIDRYVPDDSSTTTTLARSHGARSAVGAPISVDGGLWGALQVASAREAGLPAGAEERVAAFAELAATGIANAQAREDLRRVAAEQAALRRVATLVAGGARSAELFAAVGEEVGTVLEADVAAVLRYDQEGGVTIVAAWARSSDGLGTGVRGPLGGTTVTTLVFETGKPARVDSYGDDVRRGPWVSGVGLRSGVGAPISVDGRLWGVMAVGSTGDEPLAAGTEDRLAAFTDLVATAIANAHAQSELTASRARLVATGDETRRRIERDLHDGAQQRLASLALQLRGAQTSVPPGLAELQGQLADLAAEITDVLDELSEMARGIHPPMLAEGGLGLALRTLARRSVVPVELDVRTQGRLPEPLEVAVYYVVSEALTNAAKHARASSVAVEVEDVDGVLRVRVRDDGAGGADFTRGSGLVGLKDRVEALDGRISVNSAPNAGTAIHVQLPLADEPEPSA